MPTISRDQLVLHRGLAGEEITFTTLQLTKTATMSYGTLLQADQTEATATELAAGTYDIGFIIDDVAFEAVADGQTMAVRCVRRPDLVITRASMLKLGATVLTAPQVALFEAGSNAVTQ
ncbi:hypothetical protein NVP1121O_019 [Vibrio phage 1.121.O._10N.286.46.C4]|nr:hypothetical protein NVP1121O_019 [Vibrio phage 1.121.O._10N.286.46.C4]